VLATPGLAQNWQADGNGTPQIQQQFEGGPINWQRQTDAFISGGMGGSGGGRKRIMPAATDPNTIDRENWRMQQQQKVSKIYKFN
jgi:hypothetical protein